jgi:signal transduction histidine kinase
MPGLNLPTRWRLPRLPRSLRGQFTLALWILALLSMAGGIASVYALRTSSSAAQDLAQGRLSRMQQAQDIVQRTLQIVSETDRLVNAPSLAAMLASYSSVVQQTTGLDGVVQGLTNAGETLSVLDLQQANQLFRNNVDVVAQSRESVLQSRESLNRLVDDSSRSLESGSSRNPALANLLYRLEAAGTPEAVEKLQSEFGQLGGRGALAAWKGDDPFSRRVALLGKEAALMESRDRLTTQSQSLVAAARQQSSALDADYRTAVQQLVEQSRRNERWVLALLAISLLFTWLVSGVFRRHVLKRLQHVSRHMLLDGTTATPLRTLVHGRDEIGDMARAVDRFLADRTLLHTQTTELRETHARLLAAARVAGMAEIATNILHNVGNVLNSINVSADLIRGKLRSSKVGGLARAVRLLDDNAHDLERFLASDDKGRLLLAYLRDLGPALEAEHDAMSTELQELAASVEHVKNVVATQQSFAGAPRLVEERDVGALTADAVRMCAAALARHKVLIVNNVNGLPALPVDSNRMLQILVNLIGNAKQAFESVTDRRPCVTVDADLCDGTDGQVLRLTVTDNGEGIAPQNLTRIFSHGFTTRKNGHGFGLHSSVLAAQEMGGTLIAHSQGEGQGAAFVLEVPVGPRKEQP